MRMEDNGTCEGNNVTMNTCDPMDRISDLPDSMVHHIFSFLETKPVIQTCILSSRWRVNIRSPNLESFKFFGCMSADISLVNLPYLINAAIEIYRHSSVEIEKEMFDRFLTQVLKGIYNIDPLEVEVDTLKDIADIPSTMEMLPTTFHNLSDVTVRDMMSYITGKDSVKAMAAVLNALPTVQVFVWRRKITLESTVKEDCEEWLPTQCVLPCLKTCEIQNANGVEDELAFLKYILVGAKCLKEIIITTPDDRNVSAQFCQKLLALPRASSSVDIRYRTGHWHHRDFLGSFTD